MVPLDNYSEETIDRMAKAAEPEVDWADVSQWENVYEPSSDTFFLCDGVAALASRIRPGAVFVEVGSGSGYATAYASRFMAMNGIQTLHFTTDINMRCCEKTAELCRKNGVLVAPIRDYFFSHFRGPIDVVMFNPPYVETPQEELEDAQHERGIAASWAGGEDGAVVIYQFLEFIDNNRSKFADDFMVILLVSVVNKPIRLRRFCKKHGLKYETVLKRNCQEENLQIAVITPEID